MLKMLVGWVLVVVAPVLGFSAQALAYRSFDEDVADVVGALLLVAYFVVVSIGFSLVMGSISAGTSAAVGTLFIIIPLGMGFRSRDRD